MKLLVLYQLICISQFVDTSPDHNLHDASFVMQASR